MTARIHQDDARPSGSVVAAALTCLSASLLVALLLIPVGCSRDNLEPLEGKVVFSIREAYDPPHDSGYPRIELSMATEKIYPESYLSIAAGVWIDGPLVAVDIDGIHYPDVLLTMPGPAVFTWPLDLAGGRYVCRFSYGGHDDTYFLTVTDSSIRVSGTEGSITKPPTALCWRHPVNSFAYVCGTTEEDTWVYDDFLDSLRDQVSLTEFGFPDSGVIPYPRSSSGHHRDMPAKYFLYQNDADFEEAGRVLKEYSKNVLGQRQGIGIMLVDWKNKRHTSWEN
ncbi:MAG: hypothetical protein NTX53_04800 [candidate division WOR-3 bacterium]|nr:hypothetical protein [candidate division WOR-3 bacterium]